MKYFGIFANLTKSKLDEKYIGLVEGKETFSLTFHTVSLKGVKLSNS